MNIKTKEVKKKKAKKGRRTNKRKLVHQEFGQEVGNIFTETLGDIKIEKEAKKLKAEGIDIDELSCDEFNKRYGKWTKYELECLRAKLEEGKNNG
ncbi:hypothetical protein [Brachyspira hyodysenteriae]|uniref:hypothetical protein n=1 Tax=Brachyspira hyodysenteriae TaxID=159 RepID=UPI0022CD422E|nr:hypothetical protein [Brachyspira hyodysenteriae]MCZ9850211.1 hypothetical protein [Brachyspira hyodysenteriae]MCZ9878181.1 hypothetical protein [Brachyspira hyodysenteriae]MCZ9889686.1 hypothetical protein [Brachyspira hyodysenteriae]MCZ9894629.1 hypothetical protein [Brachyspira hyodysenteriae]MCZ9898326.1 hypothetical protein [Brachyspira hyodysenteriae]